MQKERGSVSVDREPRFVLHGHFAKHHHFYLHLERDGVLKSLAVPAEDPAMEYIGFEGTIPEGRHGAGR